MPKDVPGSATVQFEYDTAERIVRVISPLIDFLESSKGGMQSILSVYEPPPPPRCRFGRLGLACRALFGKPNCRAERSRAADSSAIMSRSS